MSSLKDYPAGRGVAQERYIKDTLVQFSEVRSFRQRLTLLQINAGFTLLPALPGVRWQLTDWVMIALGGNATSATSINIIGTSGAAAVQLAVAAVAGLTRSAVLRAGAANATVLADGASFLPMDVNTAITAITVGSALTVSTGIDIFADYMAVAG
jgi:hypothetical protein